MQSFGRISSRAGKPLVLAALSLAIVGAFAAPGAHASAFQLHEDDAASMGRAYAGSATAGGDVSVVANNPAAMADLQGTWFGGDITPINFGANFSGSAHDAQGNPIGGGNGGNGGTTIPVPALFFATQLGDKWHVGAAFTVPFGFQTDYNSNWEGRYSAIETKLQSLDATLSASYNVTDNFALGASFIAQRTSATLSSAINYNAVAVQAINGVAPGAGPALANSLGITPGTDGIATIKGDDWAYGWQFGAYYKATPDDRFALDYHSRISHDLQGTANFTVPAAVQAELPTFTLLNKGYTPFQHTDGSAALTTPAFATASYWHQADKFGLGIDASWTQWSVLRELTVDYANPGQPSTVLPFNWRNTWMVAVGGDYYLTDKLTLRAGYSIDTTPTEALYRDARVPDSTRRTVAVGLGYKASQHFDLNVAYEHVFVNAAHVDADTSSTGDILTGQFNDYGNVLSLSAQYHF